ncbi:uncharacterized protein LOC123010356 [Tribolium madens]|uniref:uncharacterized protein LOC123010356 n=1 Tax=Tribolium madens TaxID=41895 RepID=UPI001CF74A19|nr:uncharacterized protein LOC123010356 [Tribolium madens]
MLFFFLSMVLSVSVLNAEENTTYYCIVNSSNSDAIVVLEPAAGRNTDDKDSRFLDNSTVTLNTTLNDKWSFVTSLSKSENKFHEPVSDKRWETLPNSHSKPDIIEKALKNTTLSAFFSVRLNNVNETSNIKGSKTGWNLLMKNGSTLYLCDKHQSPCSESLMEKNGSQVFNDLSQVLWKLHEYSYHFYAGPNRNTIIYTSDGTCEDVQQGCLTIYLAMCKNCKMIFSLKSNNANSKLKFKNITGTGTWMTVEIDLDNFAKCFTFAVDTIAHDDVENVFWAISDKIYMSSQLSCQENKRYIALQPKKNITNFLCETVKNETLSFTTQLPNTFWKNTYVPNRTTIASIYRKEYVIVTIVIILSVIVVTVIRVRSCCKLKTRQKLGKKTSDYQELETVSFINDRDFAISTIWNPIKRKDFENYVKRIFKPDSQELQNQFGSLPSEYLEPHSEGVKIENLSKNCFSSNFCPYDRNRVKLKRKKFCKVTCGYINASYIQGCSNYREYIATQNPLENTVNDFWYMVWQENIKHIVMISSYDDSFFCYWPQKKDTRVVYDNIKITLDDIEQHQFYKRRVFKIEYKKITRQIEQLHYDSWDENDSESIKSSKLIGFVDRLLKIPHLSSPILVHCRAGIGRTGLIILCDIVLRSLPLYNTIDIYSTTKALRKSKVHMLHTLELYKLAHLVFNYCIDTFVKMLFYFILSVISSVSVLNAEENTTYYCVANSSNFDAIVVLEPAVGKDIDDKESRFLDNSTVTLNTKLNDTWTFVTSLDKTENKFHEPISDKRWETLPNSHSKPSEIRNALKNTTLSAFFSVRLNYVNETSNIKSSKTGWNLLMKNGSTLYLCDKHQSPCSESLMEKNGSQVFNDLSHVLWKLHEYSYHFYAGPNRNTIIYTSDGTCEDVQQGCLTIYLAMCKNCKMIFSLKSNNANSKLKFKNITGTGTWMTVEIDLDNFTKCFTFTVDTIAQDDVENVFWAIGDKIYMSSQLSCQENKRYIALQPKKNITNFLCETVKNETLNFTTQLTNYEEDNTKRKVYNTKENITLPSNNNIEKANSFSVVYIIIIILSITIIAIIVFVILYKKRLWRRTQNQNSVRFGNCSDSENLIDNNATKEETFNLKDSPSPIPQREFEAYIRKCCEDSTDLQLQFSALPSGYLKDYNEGKKMENLDKNRYPNIIPYDVTRVKLEKNLGDVDHTTDYINASYIKGVDSDKEYIVTQNPLEHTVIDFWRMIWQEKVEHIVMISNKEEKVYQYWPQLKKSVSYGGTEILCEVDNVHEFYDHRVFTVQRFGENRTINQFHFHAWSKEMLAAYVFADFINRLLMIPHHSAPVVFHCLAGVGRSATIVLCDIALRSVAKNGTFDLFKITKTMRECRVNMVQNLKQYLLAHLIIFEALNYEDLAIALDEDYENHFSKYFEGNYVKKLWSKFLENRNWIDEAIMPYDVCANYPNMNRYTNPSLLPVEHSRVFLGTQEEPKYIHAMYVNDYNQMKNFIVAQQPMRATLENFWLMILEKSVTTIINLHELDRRRNHTYSDLYYFPVLDQTLKIGDDILVKLDSKEHHSNYDKINIVVTKQSRERKIKLLYVKNWQKNDAQPDSTDVVINLWDAMGDQNPDYPTLICCDDGIRASSFVACFFYMADKMIHERKCDVVGAVRAVRRTHHSFINFEQFVFLFHCAVAFYKNCVK